MIKIDSETRQAEDFKRLVGQIRKLQTFITLLLKPLTNPDPSVKQITLSKGDLVQAWIEAGIDFSDMFPDSLQWFEVATQEDIEQILCSLRAGDIGEETAAELLTNGEIVLVRFEATDYYLRTFDPAQADESEINHYTVIKSLFGDRGLPDA